PGDRRAIARVREVVPALAGYTAPRAARARSLEDVRAALNRLDGEIAPLLETRGRWVEAAVAFERSGDEG
ncbi:MAG TPA: hypothetical protein VF912_12850, partial [Anaeromyxobacter sp.]